MGADRLRGKVEPAADAPAVEAPRRGQSSRRPCRASRESSRAILKTGQANPEEKRRSTRVLAPSRHDGRKRARWRSSRAWRRCESCRTASCSPSARRSSIAASPGRDRYPTATMSPALVLLADLAERNDLATALALIERVLLRDLDHPGARERHRRWRASLGFDLERTSRSPGRHRRRARAGRRSFDLLRGRSRQRGGGLSGRRSRKLRRHVALKVYHQPERDKTQLAHEARVAVALRGRGHRARVFDVDP